MGLCCNWCMSFEKDWDIMKDKICNNLLDLLCLIIFFLLIPVFICYYCIALYNYNFAKRPNKMFGTHD